MIELIEYNFRLAKVTEDLNEKRILLLENYLMILGYLVAQNDYYYFLNSNDVKLTELEEKIKKLLNTDYNILGRDKNSLESFKIFVNLLDTQELFFKDKLSKDFLRGYNTYLSIKENKDPFDFILGTKQNFEFKLRRYI